MTEKEYDNLVACYNTLRKAVRGKLKSESARLAWAKADRMLYGFPPEYHDFLVNTETVQRIIIESCEATINEAAESLAAKFEFVHGETEEVNHG